MFISPHHSAARFISGLGKKGLMPVAETAWRSTLCQGTMVIYFALNDPQSRNAFRNIRKGNCFIQCGAPRCYIAKIQGPRNLLQPSTTFNLLPRARAKYWRQRCASIVPKRIF